MKNIVNIIKEEVSNIVNEATETNVIWDTMKTPQWNEMLTKIKEEYNIDNVIAKHVRGEEESTFYLERTGYIPIKLFKLKNIYLINDNYIDWLTKTVLEWIPKVLKGKFWDLSGNVRKLPSNANIDDKIRMWELIGQKANKLYNSRKHSENWVYIVREKYGNYWDELYDEIKNTPEFKTYRKKNGDYEGEINFGDMLA